MPLSKPFAIATEGKTVDGRVISREWITQMAASYDPKVYTAVANLEHYLSSLPDSVFGPYGKVVSLSTREVELMGDKKLQLLAVVDANDKLVSLQKQGQKCFASMEVLQDFIGKGVAYLSGLAFTNTPASIGTEAMKFSMAAAQGERYAFADEVAIEFETEKTTSEGEGLFTKIMNMLGTGKKESDSRFTDLSKAIEAIAQSQKELIDKFASIEPITGDLIEGKAVPSADEFAALKEAHDKVAAEFAAIKEKLSGTDGDTNHRGKATGGNGQVKTDC